MQSVTVDHQSIN